MFDKNSFLHGLGLGILAMLAGYVVAASVYKGLDALGWVSDFGLSPMFRQRTCGLLAIAVNVILLNKFQKRYAHDSVRGIVIATILGVVLWLVLFGKYVL